MAERETAGALAVAVPENVTFCGLPVALSLMFNTVVRVPGAVGLNMTWMKQLAPAAREARQLFVWVKSPALPPVRAMELMVKRAFPELVTQRFSGPPFVPTE